MGCPFDDLFLAQVKEFDADFRNSGLEIERKSNADGAWSGERRCSEDLLD
jgi:hypothetical protein